MTRKIYVISESEDDPPILQALLNAQDINVRVVNRTKGPGGVSRLADKLERLIQTIRQEPNRSQDDCIVVLHDVDTHSEPRREHYNKIKQICEKHLDIVVRIEARETIEAWLLSNDGMCQWLGILTQDRDGLTDPKGFLKTKIRNKHIKIKYQAFGKQKVVAQIKGIIHSTSFKEAIKQLRDAGCLP